MEDDWWLRLLPYGPCQDQLGDLLADLVSAQVGENEWVMWHKVMERC